MSGSTKAIHGNGASSGQAHATSSSHVAALVAPIIAIGVTAASRKALAVAYRSMTGSPAPSTKDRRASLGSVIAWAALTGATAAVIEAVIFRATARAFDDL